MDKPVILAVDRDDEMLRQVRQDLERAYGERYRVLSAMSGGEGLKVLRQQKEDSRPVALVLVDLSLSAKPVAEFLEDARRLYPDLIFSLARTFPNPMAPAGFLETGHCTAIRFGSSRVNPESLRQEMCGTDR
ncbi:MAG TPA: hypothetical protein VE135_02250 [Pyrinomonadaceae bacterium]|nr:hypothetical protein [Pyrinomonadaceae bacterium]